MTDTQPILAIDTATNQLALALFWPKNQHVEKLVEPAQRGGERLHVAIESMLETAKISLKDLSAIVVAIGPGSFTGIRVGIAAAQGLTNTLGIPLVGVSNMEAQAQPHQPITLWNEAHGGQVYVQKFGENGPLAKAESFFVADAVQKLKGRVGGNALHTYKDELPSGSEVVEGAEMADPEVLAKLGWQKLQEEGTKKVQPLYVKPLTYKKLEEQGKQ